MRVTFLLLDVMYTSVTAIHWFVESHCSKSQSCCLHAAAYSHATFCQSRPVQAACVPSVSLLLIFLWQPSLSGMPYDQFCADNVRELCCGSFAIHSQIRHFKLCRMSLQLICSFGAQRCKHFKHCFRVCSHFSQRSCQSRICKTSCMLYFAAACRIQTVIACSGLPSVPM